MPEFFDALHRNFLSRLNKIDETRRRKRGQLPQIWLRDRDKENLQNAQNQLFAKTLSSVERFVGKSQKGKLSKFANLIKNCSNNPAAWTDAIKKNKQYLLERCGSYDLHAKNKVGVINELLKKVESGAELNDEDMKNARTVFVSSLFWDILGIKPAELSTASKHIIANAQNILTAQGRRTGLYFSSVFHLLYAMGLLFDPAKNRIREGIKEELERRSQAQVAEHMNYTRETAHLYVNERLAALDDLEKIFIQINNLWKGKKITSVKIGKARKRR